MSRPVPEPSAPTGPRAMWSASRVVRQRSASRHVRVTTTPLAARPSQSYTTPSRTPAARCARAYACSRSKRSSSVCSPSERAASSPPSAFAQGELPSAGVWGCAYSARWSSRKRSEPASMLSTFDGAEHGERHALASSGSTALPAIVNAQRPRAGSTSSAVSCTDASAASSSPRAAPSSHCSPRGGMARARVLPCFQCAAAAACAA